MISTKTCMCPSAMSARGALHVHRPFIAEDSSGGTQHPHSSGWTDGSDDAQHGIMHPLHSTISCYVLYRMKSGLLCTPSTASSPVTSSIFHGLIVFEHVSECMLRWGWAVRTMQIMHSPTQSACKVFFVFYIYGICLKVIPYNSSTMHV